MKNNLQKDIKHIINFKLKPKQAIAYLKSKGYKLTFNYKELMHEAHHKAFTVAKIQRLDLLYDIKESILKAQKEGLSFNSWKKNIKPILIKKGWWGEVEVVDKTTGEVKTIKVNNHRLKTIFYTNTRVAYQVAKAKKFYKDDTVEYLRYVAILDNAVRPSHKKMHGTILPKNHEFWKLNYPPNGWNCRCRVMAVSDYTIQKSQNKIKESLQKVKETPLIADKDWAYDIREGRFFDKFKGDNVEQKAFSDFKDFHLPSAAQIKEQNLPPAPERYRIKDKVQALEILEKEILKGKKEATIKTPVIDILFDIQKLEHIVKKDIRAEFAKYILPTLHEPDEIWGVKTKDKQDAYFKKRYRYIKLFKEKKENTLAISELLRDGSVFVTFIKINKLSQIDKQRVGILMYVRKLIFGE